MTVYKMILHECDGSTTEMGGGVSYRDLDELRNAAVRLARAIMADEISQGRLCLSCWIVALNEQGHSVMTVPFGSAVEMLDYPACPGS